MTEKKPNASDLPLVSVIVPVYNGERYLAEALDSVLAQTYTNFEAVVIDDGSMDQSAEIVRGYGDRIVYAKQENSGTGSARNRGVHKVRGDLLAFLDQDDRWEPKKLSEQVSKICEAPEIEAVFGMVRQFITPEADAQFRARIRCPGGPVVGYLPSAILVRREAFLKVGLFGKEWRLGEWADWFARAKSQKLRTEVLPTVVAWRRLHPGNKGLVLAESREEYAKVLHAAMRRSRDQPTSDVLTPESQTTIPRKL